MALAILFEAAKVRPCDVRGRADVSGKREGTDGAEEKPPLFFIPLLSDFSSLSLSSLDFLLLEIPTSYMAIQGSPLTVTFF